MNKEFIIALIVCCGVFAVVFAAPKKIASVKVDDERRIDGESINVSNITASAEIEIAAATNALARVAHTGSYTNLVNRPLEFRACLDGDGITRYRLFSTTPEN